MAKRLGKGKRLWRIYFQGGSHPAQWDDFRHFGATSSRFDHHTPPKRVQARGILYATLGKEGISTALAEVFQDTRHIDRRHRRPWLASFELIQPVELLDTGSKWPVRAGGNMAINSGARGRARAWSRAIYRGYPALEGIWYPSSLTNQPCVALYQRAAHALPPRPSFNQPLSHPSLLANLTQFAAKLNYTL
jgi:hypothetical protein